MNIELRNPKDIKTVVITTEDFKLDDFIAVVRYGAQVEFGADVIAAVKKGRQRINNYLEEGRIYYGVTTGVGDNVRHILSYEEANKLQNNIIRTHAVAVGIPYTKEQARAMMLVELTNHKMGWGGVAFETLELIRQFLNRDLYPFLPGEGTVGALGVEGHLAMAMIGEGEFFVDGERIPAKVVLDRERLQPRVLECKEGLSLLDGCISSLGLALLSLYDCINAMKSADIACALAFEALRSTTKTLDERIYMHKQHLGDRASAENLRRLTAGSEILETARNIKVQDAYVTRCAPRVHGAGKKIVVEAYDAIMRELNSCQDNPQIYEDGTENGECLMSGAFDATGMAIHTDFLCSAATLVATNCERTTARILDHNLNEGLPAFLVNNPGLNSGFMIPQYTQAGLLTDMKALCMPATIDSIPVSAGQEDPNPMAYGASVKATTCMRKFEYIVAIEIVNLLQAIDFVKKDSNQAQGPVLQAVYNRIRENVSFLDEDRFIYPDLEYVYNIIHSGELVELVESIIGPLNFE